MKKLYTEDKWKAHSKKSSEYILRKKSRRRKKKPKKGKYSFYPRRLNVLTAPVEFCLIHNYVEVRDFVEKVVRMAKCGRSVFMDMRKILVLKLDSIIFLVSWLDKNKSILEKVRLRCRPPKNEDSCYLLDMAGFYNIVKPNRRIRRAATNNNVLSLKRGDCVKPTVAKEVLDFTRENLNAYSSGAKEKFSNDAKEKFRNIYAILIECMANTKNHAYSTKYKEFPKWWLMAIYDQDCERVHFAFLDRGLGIPTTIRTNIREKVLNSVTLRIILKKKHGDLIFSALQGERRTRTKQVFRGKGLPKIHSCASNWQIKNLLITSNLGYIDFEAKNSKPHIKNLNDEFDGTLLSWDIWL